jgi:hypothetical protein
MKITFNDFGRCLICLKNPCQCKKEKVYILKKDCPRLGKEIGDYYNNEFAESIEELLERGIIEEENIES